MKIDKELLEQEVEKYNKIVEELQKLSAQTNQLEAARLKQFGRLELIQESLTEDKTVKSIDPVTKDISIDEVILSEKKKKKG